MNREMKISYTFRNNKTFPKVIITNRILNRYGFNVGDKVSVSYSNNQIIIIKK